MVRSISVNTQKPTAGDKPRKRTFHGDPPFLVKFVFGFVIGAVGGVFISLNEWRYFPDFWIMTPDGPWRMILLVAVCGTVCGLLAGFFRRKRHDR